MKKSRIVYICISIVYILVAAGATAYCLTAYQDSLPQVELIPSIGARVPKSCLLEGPNGMVMNIVERQDGRIFIRRHGSTNLFEVVNYGIIIQGVHLSINALSLF